MHIVLGLLGVAGAVAFFIIRANMAAQAARELGDVAADAKGMIRRRKWNKKLSSDLVQSNQDPVLSAALIICTIAQADGALSADEIASITQAMQNEMGLSRDQVEDALGQARFLAKDVADPNVLITRSLGAVNQVCTVEEKQQLLDIASAVAQTDGPLTDIQTAAIRHLKYGLGLN